MSGLYADPMLYDILYTPGTAAEVDVLERLEKIHADGPLANDRCWFEPACGSGRYLRVAANRGRQIAGYDRDKNQITYAQKRLPRHAKHLFVADMLASASAFGNLKLPRNQLRLAINPVNSLRHLASDKAIVQHLDQMARLMARRSLYIIGISLVNYDHLWPEEDLWEGVRGGCRVTQLVNYLPPEPDTPKARREQVVSHLTVTRPRSVQHFDTTYDLHCCDLNQWHRIVEKSPWRLAGSYDHRGKHRAGRELPYQLEVLRRQS